MDLDVIVSDFLLVHSEGLELFFSSLASGFDSEQPLLFEVYAMFVFIHGQTSPMDIEVLILVLTLILALEPF